MVLIGSFSQIEYFRFTFFCSGRYRILFSLIQRNLLKFVMRFFRNMIGALDLFVVNLGLG